MIATMLCVVISLVIIPYILTIQKIQAVKRKILYLLLVAMQLACCLIVLELRAAPYRQDACELYGAKMQSLIQYQYVVEAFILNIGIMINLTHPAEKVVLILCQIIYFEVRVQKMLEEPEGATVGYIQDFMYAAYSVAFVFIHLKIKRSQL